MSLEPLNVLVTDDHTLFRRGTMKLIETFDEVGKIHEAENGEIALKILAEEDIQLVLLDLEMPVLDGWETSKKIVSKYPDVYIIVVSMFDDLRIISDLIEIGVHSYLLKNADPSEMQQAIQAVMSNQFYYNQLISKALHSKISQKKNVDTSHLTNRELEIIELICLEHTMKEISDKLFLSEQTVLTHRRNLMKKINAKNSVSIVRYAIQNQIIQL